MDDSIKQQCVERYEYYFMNLYEDGIQKSCADGSRISETKKKELEKSSQKAAIKQTLVDSLSEYPEEDAADLWKYLYEAHVHRKSGIDDSGVIEKVISADQSWKKSSGHAFEEFIKEEASRALNDFGIEIVLQRDLSELIAKNELANKDRDIALLKQWIAASTFDLYAIVDKDGQKYCFGCLQSKTSIRDRVTRDREPSIQAMNDFFWSVAITLDGDFLRLPKFVHMVNGGTDDYPTNGWHGMYVFSCEDPVDRIYETDINFSLFVKHAVEAAEFWLEERQWFNSDWKPTD